jgi:hypothetical protein
MCFIYTRTVTIKLFGYSSFKNMEFVRGAINHKGWFTYTELDYDCIVLDCWPFSAKFHVVAGKSRTASK